MVVPPDHFTMTEDRSLRVSLVQLTVTGDRDRNVDRALELCREAAASDPDLIVLPENFNFTGTEEEKLAHAETMDGPTLPKLRELAADLGVYVGAGSIKMAVPGDDLLRNRHCVIDPAGEVQAVYEKFHIFNADVGDTQVENTMVERGGDDIVVTDINGVAVGLTICFDVRFPELYRILALRGAEVILVPSMFTLHTGKDHWDTLLKARAIENQVYVVAPAVYGRKPTGSWTYGRSAVVNPWGIIEHQAADHETVLTADLDLSLVDEVRASLPTLNARRPEAYDWPDRPVAPSAADDD